jgi:hypothetical protein
MFLALSCKDPREKTIWDYVDGEIATDAEYHMGVEMLHQDLIRHGYMKEHSCFQLDCYSNHKNTYADIDRVNKLVEGSNK